MAVQSRPPVTVIVAGDSTIDWNFARFQRPWPNKDDEVHAYQQRGGTLLLQDLIEAIADELKQSSQTNIEISPLLPRIESSSPSDTHFHHYFATFEQMGSRDPAAATPKAWRIRDFLGLQRGATPENLRPVEDEPPSADILVLDDMGLGFRTAHELWPRAINEATSGTWVLLKMANPVADGPLWERLSKTERLDRLIVVVTIEDLRRSQVQISWGLSWEQTAQDLARAIVFNTSVNALANCAYVVISFGPVGALLFSRFRAQSGTEAGVYKSAFTLLFDPTAIEGSWERLYEGRVFGGTHTLVAAIARELMSSPHGPNLADGVRRGLNAIRDLYRWGFINQLEGSGHQGEASLAFPISRIVDSIATNTTRLATVAVPDPLGYVAVSSEVGRSSQRRAPWTILHEQRRGDLYTAAHAIVLHGPEEALYDVPLAQFRAFTTVDRQEIESFRSIQNLIREYDRTPGDKRPLSIAVFGAPGSGKSFGVTQVAQSVLPERIQKCEFNMSQFDSRKDLTDAFEQVGHVGLVGKLPLVFWDEFDTALDGESFGWIHHFLAPMQDGTFQLGQLSHPIGRAIFVFAGGTFHGMDQFQDASRQKDGRVAKLPDFISRLRGYINIRGVDPDKTDREIRDQYFIVRRAIVLRSILERTAQHLFKKGELQIDEGVLRAFLKTKSYKHGVRSMEAVLSMSRLTGYQEFGRSSLPPESQLELHVDAKDFTLLVREFEWTRKQTEQLARRIHEEFRGAVDAEGARHPANVPWNDLPEDDRAMDRLFVEGLDKKLRSLRCVLVRSGRGDIPAEFSEQEIEDLAKSEHEIYRVARLRAGWKFSAVTDWENKQDRQLLPWENAPAERKAVVRRLVSAVPRILREEGFVLVRRDG